MHITKDKIRLQRSNTVHPFLEKVWIQSQMTITALIEHKVKRTFFTPPDVEEPDEDGGEKEDDEENGPPWNYTH